MCSSVPGVYISYPFCSQKCSFCNFASGVAPVDIRARYEQALFAEVSGHEWTWSPETLYFGGGTPSLMPLEVFRGLMDALPRVRIVEATIECAPGTIHREAVHVWQELGINRVSLGVQSFVKEELRQTGRRHTAETVQNDLELLRQASISNVNIDLIAGLPGQTCASWECSLDWIERLDVPHVSVYIFEIDEDSRLGKELLLGGARYGATQVPDDELTSHLYERAVVRLGSMGLRRYEISNFGREGCQSRHNLKYWRLEPYVGFGLDAHSFDGRHRWSNPDTLEAYLKRSHFRASAREMTATDPAEEHFFVGLRLMDGIEPAAHEWERFAAPIEKWMRAGMLERDGNRLRLTGSAVLVSNEIFEEFINV